MLHVAIEDSKVEVVKNLVLSAEAKAYRHQGYTPIGGGTAANEMPIREITDRNGWTPLHAACNAGCIELIEFLLTNPLEPHPVDVLSIEMATPLHYFVRHPMPPTSRCSREKYFALLTALLGPPNPDDMIPKNVNVANRNGDTPLHIAVGKAASPDLIMFLLLNQAMVNAVNKYVTPFLPK